MRKRAQKLKNIFFHSMTSFYIFALKIKASLAKAVVKGKLMPIWKSGWSLHMKMIYWRFHIKAPFIFWDMRTWDMWNVCLQTIRNNGICLKLNLQTLCIKKSRFLRIQNARLSGYCFLRPQTYKEILKSALLYL